MRILATVVHVAAEIEIGSSLRTVRTRSTNTYQQASVHLEEYTKQKQEKAMRKNMSIRREVNSSTAHIIMGGSSENWKPHVWGSRLRSPYLGKLPHDARNVAQL